MAERHLYLALFAGGGLLIVLFSGVLAKSWVLWSIKLGYNDAQRYEKIYRRMYLVIGTVMCAFGIFLWFTTATDGL